MKELETGERIGYGCFDMLRNKPQSREVTDGSESKSNALLRSVLLKRSAGTPRRHGAPGRITPNSLEHPPRPLRQS